MSPHTTSTDLKKRPEKRLKQFRCEGHGDCKMVFSRSEHLLRHLRKHTGEKPYKCEHPGCSKTFSRYDNMRQHHMTHRKEMAKQPSESETEEEGNVLTGRLTQDELDALDALNQFRHPPHATYTTTVHHNPS